MVEEINYSVGQLLEAINNKADLDGSNLDNTSFETFINSLVDAKLGNIDYVVESKLPTTEDRTWYRLYKSGWLEQGGYSSGSSSWNVKTINLLKPYKDNMYSVSVSKATTLSTTDTSTASVRALDQSVSFGSRTTESFAIGGYYTIEWVTKGQSA